MKHNSLGEAGDADGKNELLGLQKNFGQTSLKRNQSSSFGTFGMSLRKLKSKSRKDLSRTIERDGRASVRPLFFNRRRRGEGGATSYPSFRYSGGGLGEGGYLLAAAILSEPPP